MSLKWGRKKPKKKNPTKKPLVGKRNLTQLKAKKSILSVIAVVSVFDGLFIFFFSFPNTPWKNFVEFTCDKIKRYRESGEISHKNCLRIPTNLNAGRRHFETIPAACHTSPSPKHKHHLVKIYTSYRPAVAQLNSTGIQNHCASLCP